MFGGLFERVNTLDIWQRYEAKERAVQAAVLALFASD